MSGADPNRVYALIENEKGGLFSSDDAGKTWALVNENRNIRQRAFYYTHVTADPVAKDTVYLLNVSGYRSTDGGKTLTNIGQGTHGDHRYDQEPHAGHRRPGSTAEHPHQGVSDRPPQLTSNDGRKARPWRRSPRGAGARAGARARRARRCHLGARGPVRLARW